jgi:DNA-directed RNA polymerase specialized sigma24 family protein
MPSSRSPEFPTTHWTLVQIVQGRDKKQAALALEDICSRYWYPVYAFLRRSDRSHADAEDLTQMLFQHLVADESLQQVRQERGRLRNFLIGTLKRLLSDHARHEKAAKRGGGAMMLSLDEMDAESRYTHEPKDLQDPERLYDRAWAMQLIESVRNALRDSFLKTGRKAEFDALEPYLGWEDAPAPYAELAARFGSNETAARVLVHRLRQKFRQLLQAEISKTVVNPEDIEAELSWLRQVLKS